MTWYSVQDGSNPPVAMFVTRDLAEKYAKAKFGKDAYVFASVPGEVIERATGFTAKGAVTEKPEIDQCIEDVACSECGNSLICRSCNL